MSAIAESARPVLPRGVRLKHDKVRDRWVLLAPERVLFPCPVSQAILERCDGSSSVAAILDALAAEYDAPREAIAQDVTALLDDLAGKGFLRLEEPRP
jgi:pyrroloquinoline quinone biosynthesis protein D